MSKIDGTYFKIDPYFKNLGKQQSELQEIIIITIIYYGMSCCLLFKRFNFYTFQWTIAMYVKEGREKDKKKRY